jgi:hypothetical protein
MESPSLEGGRKDVNALSPMLGEVPTCPRMVDAAEEDRVEK